MEKHILFTLSVTRFSFWQGLLNYYTWRRQYGTIPLRPADLFNNRFGVEHRFGTTTNKRTINRYFQQIIKPRLFSANNKTATKVKNPFYTDLLRGLKSLKWSALNGFKRCNYTLHKWEEDSPIHQRAARKINHNSIRL